MEFGIYVTPVKGRTVPRFGAPAGTYIGARRVGKQLEWDEERVVPIPENEYRRFRAEYSGAIADGALKKRTAADFEASQQALPARRKAAAEKAAAQNADTSAPAAGIRAIAETAPIVSPNASADRPKALLLDQNGGK
jgi:hypothetical protein